MDRYVASYLAANNGAITHGINTCLANSYAEAYGLMKQNISKSFNGHTIHIANVMLISSLIDGSFKAQEFESQ